jgi:RNA polymerase subunit RPABC4/transcription elongation factor Spt4
MSTSSCRFCAHVNPEGAKFCNDCGSPLHLKPCPQCEGITDVSAENCHQCGAPFVTSGAADALAKSIPANPIADATRDEPEIRAHIPESLAACLAAGGADVRARDDVVHYLGTAEPDAREPDSDAVLTRDRVVPPRKGAFYRASFVVAPVVFAAVAYYAYIHGGPAMRALTDLIVIARGTEEAAAPATAAPAVPPPVATPVDAPPAVAAPAPQTVRPDAAPRPVPPKNPGGAFQIDPPRANVSGDGPTVVGQSTKTQSLPDNVRPSAKPRPPATKIARAKKAADPAAIATQRLVARELGEFLPPNAKDRTSDPASTMN